MRPRIVRTVYLKELRESLRDRRTLFMMVGIPILIYPLLMVGMSRLQETQKAVQSARSSRVAIWGLIPQDLAARLDKEEKVTPVAWGSAPEAIRESFEKGSVAAPDSEPRQNDPDKQPEPRMLPDTAWAKAAQKAILDREVDAVLIAWPGFAKDVRSGGLGKMSILYDSVRPDSGHASARLRYVLDRYREQVLEARERDLNLERGFSVALEVDSQNVAPAQRRTGMFLGTILPYVLIMFSVMSGFYAAIDVTAGEKERGTMQTLLCAPLLPLEIITGKFLAVWSVSLMATVINILSLSLTFTRINLIPDVMRTVPTESYFVAFLMLMPISLMMTAIFLAVGAFAKDFKDGQNYLTPVLMGLLIPLSATMIPGMELNAYLAFFPVVNIALLIKGVFVGEWQGDVLFLTLLSSFAYAGMALMLAAKVFERNNVLLGGKEGLRTILDFSRVPGDKPTPSVSIFTFSVVLVLAFYGSISLLKYGIPTMLAVTQYGFFLLPTLLLVWAKGYNWKETLALRPISLKAILACTLIGLSGWTIGGGLLVRLLPPPESLTKALVKILLLGDQQFPLWQVWLFIAVTPALCEETLFRGLVLSGFKRMGKWPAIFATGLLFGLAHSSIYRLLPTMFLGIVFGYAVWRTGSVFAGMICHALNNGLMASMASSKEVANFLGLTGQKYMPWEHIAGGLVVFTVGILLLSGAKPRREDQPPSPEPVTA